MTYEELYDHMREALPPSSTFALEVETWKHGNRPPETAWKIYVPYAYKDAEQYSAPTAALVWAQYEAAHRTEVLSKTSAAVGRALDPRLCVFEDCEDEPVEGGRMCAEHAAL